MASFHLRRFSSPAVLKQVEHALLLKFLEPHRPALEGRGVEFVERARFDFDALASVLMNPGDDAPEALLDAFFFVDEVAVPECYEDLLDEARRVGIELGDTPNLSPADLAVRIWLDDPEALQRFHAERFLVRTKKFEHFPSVSTRVPSIKQPTDVVMQVLQDHLNAFFETRKKGRGTRIFPFVREESIWFLIRHGEKLKREGTIENGEPSSIFYRPEKFDIVIFDRDLGELAIHASSKGEKETYCHAFGKHLFGNEGLFSLETDGKFTLAPIIERGPDCLVCTDIDGMESARLAELQWRHDSDRYHLEIHKTDDVFAALAEIRRAIPRSATLVKAVFKVKFRSAERERSVAIKPPNVAIFDRESDAPRVHEWLTRRGFTPRVLRVAADVA